MSRIVIFGAGGRAGRAAVAAEARQRGHRVTAVVRDPRATRTWPPTGASAGDVTDPADVARLAAGHDAAVNAAADLGADPGRVLPGRRPGPARRAAPGRGAAGWSRVGLASVLDTASGTPLMDTPGYPQEYRRLLPRPRGGTAVLHAAATDLDWLVLSPAGDFDHARRTHRPLPRRRSRRGQPDQLRRLRRRGARRDRHPTHRVVHLGVEAG